MALKQAFFISLGLTLFKLLGFQLSGSMIVLASFYDSLTDSLVPLVTAALKWSVALCKAY
jgi:divalent metal cation (Fe/Co/Zn/Cd) transporter